MNFLIADPKKGKDTFVSPNSQFFKKILFIYRLIFGCIGSSLLCMGFLQLWRAGATLRCGARASPCGGFSCCRAQALGAQASVVAVRRLSSCGSRALERRLSICGTWAQLLHGMWDLPGPGIEPVSPALAGGFLTTVPPGKSPNSQFSFMLQMEWSKCLWFLPFFYSNIPILFFILFFVKFHSLLLLVLVTTCIYLARPLP